MRFSEMVGLSVLLCFSNTMIGHCADADSDAGWPPSMDTLAIPVPVCTALLALEDENRCLVGADNGQLLSISIPDGQTAEIAKLPCAVTGIAYHHSTKGLAVCGYDMQAEKQSLFILGEDNAPVKVMSRQLAPVPRCHLRWSASGEYLVEAYGEGGTNEADAVDWAVYEKTDRRLIYEFREKDLSLDATDSHLGRCVAVSFTQNENGSDDGFFAITQSMPRRCSVSHFSIDREGEDLPGVQVTGKVTFAGLASTLFNSRPDRVSILTHRGAGSRGHAYPLFECYLAQGRVRSTSGPSLTGPPVERIPFTLSKPASDLFTISHVLFRPGLQNAMLQSWNDGRQVVHRRDSVVTTDYPILRVCKDRRFAAYFSGGSYNAFHFVELTGGRPVASFQYEDHPRLEPTGGFCGMDDLYFVSADVPEGPDWEGQDPVKSTLRIWHFPREVDEPDYSEASNDYK